MPIKVYKTKFEFFVMPDIRRPKTAPSKEPPTIIHLRSTLSANRPKRKGRIGRINTVASMYDRLFVSEIPLDTSRVGSQLPKPK